MKHFTTTLSFILLLSGCADTSVENSQRGEENGAILTNITEQNIIPAVTAFQTSVNTLNTKANSFCSSVNSENKDLSGSLEQLQNAWKNTSSSWHKLMPYNFGPLRGDDILEPEFIFIDNFRDSKGRDYTNTSRADIAKDINSQTAITTDYIGKKRSNLVGLLTLEILIFETTQKNNAQLSTESNKIIADYKEAPRKCLLLKAQTQSLLNRINQISANWQAYKAGFLETPSNSLKLLLSSTQDYLEYLKQRSAPVNTAKIAQYGWENVSASIAEVDSMLENKGEGVSILSYMTKTGATTSVAAIRQNIDNLQSAISDKNITMLNVSLGELDGQFKRDIPNSLEIKLGLNFNDGD